jgi:hypothetical protein
MSARYKPGSRVQSVWETFESDGADVAIARGVSLSVSLATLRQWTRAWSKESGSPFAARPERAPRPMQTKPTVVVKFDRERVAYLIEKGPEQSHVRWADTREDRFYPNDQLEFGT